MKNSIRLIGFFAIFTCLQLQAQEMANGYYNYILNPFNLNPAFAGNNGNISAILNTKSYLSGFEDAPRNTMFGIHAPLNDIQGIGARVISDQRGAFQLTKYDATYSYQIQIDEVSDLRFGVSAGALRRMLNPSLINNIELLDQSDQTLAGGYYDETSFTAGVGMVYDYENFQFGFSVPHLVIGNEQLSEYMLLSFGYRYQIQETDFALSPLVIYQNMPVVENRFDLLLKGDYKEKVWTQIGYQSTDNLNFALGFDFGSFGLGYAYEMNNSELSNISSNSNEIVVQLSFLPPKREKQNKILSTLDEYVAKFDAMLQDGKQEYNRQEVFSEIQKIRTKLSELEKVNDKKTALKVEQKLSLIEHQIAELEKKYAN
tara:strand:- start:1399 stop:2514 length:1116 start_codon:yes stop_codon:yes gene_type:complete